MLRTGCVVPFRYVCHFTLSAAGMWCTQLNTCIMSSRSLPFFGCGSLKGVSLMKFTFIFLLLRVLCPKKQVRKKTPLCLYILVITSS